ncbi:MAG TPA: hypothetical protein VKF60_08380 [Myxococcota bacterium]|nr:hypothetical protein [Myxococcota bacterium]
MRLRNRLGISVALGAGVTVLLLAASAARAVPLAPGLEGGCSFAGCVIGYWNPTAGGNGHYYAYVPTGATPATWDEAREAAAASTLAPGSVGHLATATDLGENAYIMNTVLPVGTSLGKRLVWLGGFQNDTPTKSLPPEAGWQWVTPEAWNYTSWGPGEPNDETSTHTGDERYLTMWVHLLINGADSRGTWNDENLQSQAQAPSLGFIVEYEGAAVPEPAAALLALLGGASLLARRARR